MNPLASYLLSVLKRQRDCNTREYLDAESALNELGYWPLSRPTGYSRDQMPSCKISEECIVVDEFPTYTPSFEGYEGFDTIVDVYADPAVVDGGGNEDRCRHRRS